MKRLLRRPSKSASFAILMVVAALLAILPQTWTRRLRGALHPLAWVQGALVSAARAAEITLRDAVADPPSPTELRELRAELERVRRRQAQQDLLIGDLERRLADVSGIRDQLPSANATIIIATVLAYDADPQRGSLRINMGTREGVQVGQWVAAGVAREQRDPHHKGRELLLQQWLIGQVSQTGEFLSQVRLTTDRSFKVAARVARQRDDGAWQTSESEHALYGIRPGRMLLRHATEDYFKSGYTTVVVPISPRLPATMAIGRIVSAARVDQAPLHYNLDVRPWADASRLSYVYVIAVDR